ncbi:MAG: hypothetical protein CSA35_05640 [Dethiosulfovibrio peptidovorans]|nr:MAG: hypothetical protein CSA35_05640 [Dethiosulfovibrio peptidovorans]
MNGATLSVDQNVRVNGLYKPSMVTSMGRDSTVILDGVTVCAGSGDFGGGVFLDFLVFIRAW